MPEITAFLMTQHRKNSLGNVAKRDLRRVVSLSFESSKIGTGGHVNGPYITFDFG